MAQVASSLRFKIDRLHQTNLRELISFKIQNILFAFRLSERCVYVKIARIGIFTPRVSYHIFSLHVYAFVSFGPPREGGKGGKETPSLGGALIPY